VFVDLVQAHALAGGLGMDRDDVPGKVTNQVTAGNPGRQREALAGGVGLGQRAADFKQMRFWACSGGCCSEWVQASWGVGEGLFRNLTEFQGWRAVRRATRAADA
jgi:hypothetical protein